LTHVHTEHFAYARYTQPKPNYTTAETNNDLSYWQPSLTDILILSSVTLCRK